MRLFRKSNTYKPPWNKGKLTGQKPPFQLKHVWAIRTTLQLEKRARDLALFNLAIDSKLRGCDVVRLKIEDIAPHGYAVDRSTIRQRKTGRPVTFEITEHARQAVDNYLTAKPKIQAITCLVDRAATISICRLDNIHVWSRIGPKRSGWTRPCLARIRYGERRRRSSIVKPGFFELCNFC